MLALRVGCVIVVVAGDHADPSRRVRYFVEDSARRIADIAGIATVLPKHEDLAARLIDSLCATFVDFETEGFDRYVQQWGERDWLFGRELAIDMQQQQVTGTGAGIADDGALLVDTGEGMIRRVTSGSVVLL